MKKILIFFLVLVIGVETKAKSTPLVTSIIIEGNKVTKDYIIKREIQHPLDSPLDSALIREDRDRIDNLGIFSTVKWSKKSKEDGSIQLTFTVAEIWRIWPGLSPYYSEEQGWSVIGLINLLNFRGKNQSLFTGMSIGAEEGYMFYFQDPWIAGDHISFSFGIMNESSDHTFLPYEERENGIMIGFGKWFDYKWQLDSFMGLMHSQYTNQVEKIKFRQIVAEASIIYNTKDLYRDPSKGLKISQKLKTDIDLTNSGHNLFVWTQSIGTYWSPIKGQRKLTLGIGAELKTSFGSLNELWLSYFGGNSTVRGWTPPSLLEYNDPKNHFRFGHQQIFTSFEARQTIIPNSSVSLFSFNSEVGLTGVVFFDMGYTSKKLSDLFKNSPLLGTGFGIRIPTPQGFVLRMDYGWGFYGGKEMGTAINLGAGQKF